MEYYNMVPRSWLFVLHSCYSTIIHLLIRVLVNVVAYHTGHSGDITLFLEARRRSNVVSRKLIPLNKKAKVKLSSRKRTTHGWKLKIDSKFPTLTKHVRLLLNLCKSLIWQKNSTIEALWPKIYQIKNYTR